jgi:hypothetical protein
MLLFCYKQFKMIVILEKKLKATRSRLKIRGKSKAISQTQKSLTRMRKAFKINMAATYSPGVNQYHRP